jgi:hypothetical protein
LLVRSRTIRLCTIAVNVFTAGGTTNWTQLEGFLDPVFNQTTDPKVANERVLFVGGKAKVMTAIGRLNSTYMIADGQTSVMACNSLRSRLLVALSA